MNCIRENKNIITTINILEYEYVPEYSYSKNIFYNINEVEEHKRNQTTKRRINKYNNNIFIKCWNQQNNW